MVDYPFERVCGNIRDLRVGLLADFGLSCAQVLLCDPSFVHERVHLRMNEGLGLGVGDARIILGQQFVDQCPAQALAFLEIHNRGRGRSRAALVPGRAAAHAARFVAGAAARHARTTHRLCPQRPCRRPAACRALRRPDVGQLHLRHCSATKQKRLFGSCFLFCPPSSSCGTITTVTVLASQVQKEDSYDFEHAHVCLE